MKHVPRSWLRRFQLALLGLDVFVLGVYAYGLFFGLSGPEHTTESVHSHGALSAESIPLGVTLPVVGLAIFHLVYVLGFLWWLDKRRTWLLHTVGVLTSGTIMVLLANADSPLHVWYHLMLMLFMFFAPLVGTLASGVIFAAAFVLLIVGSLGSGHLVTDPSGHVVEMILVSLSGVTAAGGWFAFNKRYLQNTDIKVVKTLTNLVKQERSTVNLILESIADGVMIINPDGMVQLLNAGSAKMLGWTKDEAVNLQYTALLQPVTGNESAAATTQAPPPASPNLPISQTFQNGESNQAVCLIKTRDNRQIYIDVTASPIFQEEVNPSSPKKMVGVIAVLRDVDKQKREEKQRSEFISTASHEMRTPVAAIEGYLALAMNEKVSRIDTKARSFLEKAHSSTQHLGKLFQDLLTSAKAEDGRLVSHPVVIEMGQYLEQLSDSLKFAAEKKGLQVEFTIGVNDAGSPNSVMNGKVIRPLYYVHADPDRMREVITNLFDNAVKYTPNGKISIGITGNNDVVQLLVRDTGPGIPAEDIPHLFQKFYRVDNSVTRTVGGTGLGLFICRKIVELYKGRIWVESEINKGSTFYINLPRLTTQKVTELQSAEATQAANQSPLTS